MPAQMGMTNMPVPGFPHPAHPSAGMPHPNAHQAMPPQNMFPAALFNQPQLMHMQRPENFR